MSAPREGSTRRDDHDWETYKDNKIYLIVNETGLAEAVKAIKECRACGIIGVEQ